MPETDGGMNVGVESPVLGVVGAGQLGRMLCEAAAPLGVDVVTLDPTADPPAAAGARDTIHAAFDDEDAVHRLADRVDALTIEIELADPGLLDRVRDDTGVPVHPAPDDVRFAGDKLEEKRRLDDADIPVPAYRRVDDADDLAAAFETLGRPLMLKARRGGYDGRGNAPVDDVDAARHAFGALDGLIAEELVPFDRELSVIGVKGADETAAFPAGENRHEAEILRDTVVPARVGDAVRDRVTAVAGDVLDVLRGRGVYGIELFQAGDDVLVNELAPRPHNSGHYTIEGAVTSQFEQHVRAVLGWPLGSTALRDPVAMANVLGDVDEPAPARLRGADRVLATPGAALHWYGKREVRPLRKMGHVTALPPDGGDADDALRTARSLADSLTFT